MVLIFWTYPDKVKSELFPIMLCKVLILLGVPPANFRRFPHFLNLLNFPHFPHFPQGSVYGLYLFLRRWRAQGACTSSFVTVSAPRLATQPKKKDTALRPHAHHDQSTHRKIGRIVHTSILEFIFQLRFISNLRNIQPTVNQ